MKHIFFLLRYLAIFTLFVGLLGCAGTKTSTESQLTARATEATAELESFFNLAVRIAVNGNYPLAHNIISKGIVEAKRNNLTIPEKYTALTKVLTKLRIQSNVVRVRELYYRGDIARALALAEASREMLEEEGVPIPETLAYFYNKLRSGRQELFIIRPTPLPPPLRT